MTKATLGLLLLGCLASCGESNDAPGKCEALVSRMCERAIGCAMDGTKQTDCVAEAHTALPCAQADAVSDGYNSCMTELQSSPCSVLLTNNTLNLPATCHASILFKQ